MKKLFAISAIMMLGGCTKKHSSVVGVSGIIRTVVGNGYHTGTSSGVLGGYSGDGGAATDAELNNPSGIAIDKLGNIYIADYDNSRIRKVNPSGLITTFTNIPYPVGISVDDTGNLYVVTNASISKINTSGIITVLLGSSINAQCVVVDGTGNLYYGDGNNKQVYKRSIDGSITLVAGNGTQGSFGDGGLATDAELMDPINLALDIMGNIYIVDWQCIRKVSTSGIITTIAGKNIGASNNGGFSGDGGEATSAELHTPSGVAVSNSGNIYISDYYNNRIRIVNPTGIISTFAGNGFGSLNSSSSIFTGGFSGDGGLAISAELFGPSNVTVDSIGNVYIVDCSNERIRKVAY